MVELLNHMGRLWWAWTASMFWQVGLLILVIGCIDLLIRKWAWPQLRYALWSLILIKLLLPPTLSLPSGVVPELRPRVAQVLRWANSDRPVREEATTVSNLESQISDLGFGAASHFGGFAMSTDGSGESVRSTGILPVSSMGVPPMNNWGSHAQESLDTHGRDGRATHGRDAHATVTPSGITTNPPDEATASPAPGPQLEWQVYAMMTWLLGTLILGIWLCLRLQSVAGRQGYQAAAASLPQSFYNHLADCATRLGLRRIPRVAVTKRLTSPAVFGVLSPVLLMPKGYLSKLSRRDTEHLLLHELAHIKRGDLVMHSLYMLLQIVYWYHPLLWLVRRHLHHLRELSCDGTVAELLRERTPAYRQTLLETARRLLTTSVEPGLGLLGLFEDSNYLLVRLHWLTKPTWRYRTMKRVTVATIALLMFVCVLPMAQGQNSAPADVTHVNTNPAVPAPTATSANPQAQDQLAQQIAALQAQLQQLMAQQQDLQKQLKALAEQRDQTRRPVVARRETVPGQSRSEQAPLAVAPVPTTPTAPPADYERLTPEARDQLKRAQEQMRRAQEEVRRAEMDAARAQRDAQRAQAESARSAQTQLQQDLANSMPAYGDQMEKWGNSDQMKKWQADMAAWGKKMEQWGQEFGRRQAAAAGGATNDSETREMPPMPAMPVMPPMPPMPTLPPAAPGHVSGGAVPHVVVPEGPLPPAVPHKQESRKPTASRANMRTIALPKGALVEVANEVGSISIHGGDEPNCRVTATIKATADTTEQAQQIADQVKLVITPSDGQVRIAPTKPMEENRRDGPSYEVTLEVTVPRDTPIIVSQAVGNIRLTNLRGSVEATAKVGSILATGLAGRAALNADVGNIEFTAPKDFSAKVDAKANVGHIQSDFPLESTKSRGVTLGSSVSGTVGGGEGEVSLKTNVGSIQIQAPGTEPRRTERSRPAPAPRPAPTPAAPRPEAPSNPEF